MADFDSSLPVRSEADGVDARVQVKVVDKLNPGTQQMIVDADGNAHIEAHGNSPTGVDKVLRLSELGAPNPDGVYSATDNTKPASTGMIGFNRAVSPTDADSVKKITAITSGNVHALDISLHDANGNAFSNSNPLHVTFTENPVTEIHDYKKAVAIASDAFDNHNLTISSGQTFLLQQILVSASGKLKCELMIGDGAVTETFTTKAVTFNSTAAPQADIVLAAPIKVIGTVSGTTVRVQVTNLDNQAQDLYSTIIGTII